MPTYNYECEHCGHAFELEARAPGESQVNCRKCRKYTARRMISAGTSFALKGGGWYSDGYGGGNK